MDEIISLFNLLVAKKSFNVKGLLLENNDVLTLGSDSKLIGRIFELVSYEVLHEICTQKKWELIESESQTVYPDFTIRMDNDTLIGVDIKSTYRRYNQKGELKKFGFTLGSFASFLRNNTKNIAFPYNRYSGHLVIGFVYDRNENAKAGITVNLNTTIEAPYENVEYFIQEKYKISGDKPGSGNTENIGSILSVDINDFIEGKGVFSKYGNEVFEDYWRGYPLYRAAKKDYTNINEYFMFVK